MFGMGTGVTPPPLPPGFNIHDKELNDSISQICKKIKGFSKISFYIYPVNSVLQLHLFSYR